MSNHDDTELNEKAEEKSPLQTENGDDLKAAYEESQRKASENWDLFLRARADVDNVRRRAVTDVENAHKYGIEKFAREMLSVVDSLDHALAAASKGDDKGLSEGIILTHKLLLDTLDKFGIQQVDPIGQSFDPMRHEALSAQVNSDVEPNKILLVVQKGFTLHDRLLRPARVIVSKASEA